MRIAIVLVLLFAAIPSMLYSEINNDINGWDKITWGMKKSELKKLYSIEECKVEDVQYCILKDPVRILICDYKVRVYFDKKSDEGVINKVTLSTEYINFESFNSLVNAVIRKYGEPSSPPSKLFGTLEYTWCRKNGFISLMYINVLSKCSMLYQKGKCDESDKI